MRFDTRTAGGVVIALLLPLSLVVAQNDLVIGTLAGSPSPGFVDGFGRIARFRHPTGISFAGDVLFVADTGNHAIRQVSLVDGEVTTVAGDGTPGYADGPVETAQFNSPQDVLYSPADNIVYVADTGNHMIRAIVIDLGMVATVAGTGTAGWYDGMGNEAQFNSPSGLCFLTTYGLEGQADQPSQPQTNLIVADTENHCLRAIYPYGDITYAGTPPFGPTDFVVSTLAGQPESPGLVDDRADRAKFRQPIGLAEASGGVLVADSGNHAIRFYDDYNWLVTTVAGDGTPGADDTADRTASAARFNSPAGVLGAPPDGVGSKTSGDRVRQVTGHVVCDTGNHRLREIDPATSAVRTIAGSVAGYRDAARLLALFNGPWEVVSCETGGSIAQTPPIIGCISDRNNHCIRAVGSNTPPTADPGGPYSVGPDEPLVLDASQSSDPDVLLGDTVVTYLWDLNVDGQFDYVTGPLLVLDPVEVWVYFGEPDGGSITDSGSYTKTIALEVVDVFGATDKATTTVEVTGDLSGPMAVRLLGEPPWTPGTENELRWTSSRYALGYELQWSRQRRFGRIVGSLTTADLNGVATGLRHNVTYYYRVRALLAGPATAGASLGTESGLPTGPWSNVEFSTQDARAPASTLVSSRDPLITRRSVVSIPWRATESGSGFAYEVLYYAYDGALKRYPARFRPSSTKAIADKAEAVTGIIRFDINRAEGEGVYQLFGVGVDRAGNRERLPTKPDLTLIADVTPPRIRNITVSNITRTSADISWTTNERTTGVVSYGKTTAYGSEVRDGRLVRAHTVHLSGLDPETEYHFEVRASDRAGNETASGDRTFQTRQAIPLAPVLQPEPPFTAGTENTLSWIAPAVIARYVLQWDTDPGFPAPQALRTHGTSATVTGLADGTEYFYRVAAVNGEGVRGPWSNVESSTQDASPPTTSLTMRSPLSTRDNYVDLLWEGQDAVSGFHHCNLFYKKDGGPLTQYGGDYSAGGEGKAAGPVSGAIRFRADRAGGDGTYELWACGTDNVRNAEQPTGDAQLLLTFDRAGPIISNIQVSDITARSARISWSTDEPARGLVEYGQTTGYGNTQRSSGVATSHSVQLTRLRPHTTYHFRIIATDAMGNRSRSADDTFTTQPGLPAAPTMAAEPKYTAGLSNTVSWSSVRWAVDYALEVDTNRNFPSPITLHTSGRSLTVTGLSDGIKYFYRVAGINAAGEQGPYSNIVRSTQDASPPQSRVTLATTTTIVGPVVHLTPSSSDATSGVDYLRLYFAKDRGPFRRTGPRISPRATDIAFDTSPYGPGHYAFYTIAVDNVGNREAAPASPDVEVNVKFATDITYLGDLGTTTGHRALIAAKLTDATGKAVRGATISYALDSLSGALPSTDRRGFAQTTITVTLPPGTYDLTLWYNGDARFLPSLTKVRFTVKPILAPPGQRVTVRGSGAVVDGGGDRYEFDIDVTNSPLGGTVEVRDRAHNKVLQAVTLTSVNASGNSAIITGVCTVNGAGAHRFVIRVTDGTPDEFGITTTEGTFVVPTALASGNLTINIGP